jgi:hypothetical protein
MKDVIQQVQQLEWNVTPCGMAEIYTVFDRRNCPHLGVGCFTLKMEAVCDFESQSILPYVTMRT